MLLVLGMSGWDAQVVHRYTGYTVAIGGALNVLLGLHIKGMYDHGRVPPAPLRYIHRSVGYTVISASTVQTLLGTYNFIRLHRKRGMWKRLLHGTLGLAATGTYVYAGYEAFSGNYGSHRDAMFIATALSGSAALVWLLPW